MSRRALVHREQKAVQQLEARIAAGITEIKVPDEDPSDAFPFRCDRLTMDLGHVLHSNIIASPYFKERCAELQTVDLIIDEIFDYVDHLEPLVVTPQNSPSTAFCLLYSLFCLRLTEEDLDKMVRHKDSVYIRAIGFLYLRYCAHSKTLWTWFQDYVDDPEPIKLKQGSRAPEVPLGKFLRMLLTEQQLLGSQCRLPRIPTMMEKEIVDWLESHPYDSRRFTGEIGIDERGGEEVVDQQDPKPPVRGRRPSRTPSPPKRRRSRSRSTGRRRKSRSRSNSRTRRDSPDRRRRRSRSRSIERQRRSKDERRRRSRSRDRSSRERKHKHKYHKRSRSRSRDRGYDERRYRGGRG
eukprot:m.34988 g.34988  ORF g.34988 m.34988 type:complete len:351 (+) comp6574_c1_seq2:351-1403(+)